MSLLDGSTGGTESELIFYEILDYTEEPPETGSTDETRVAERTATRLGLGRELVLGRQYRVGRHYQIERNFDRAAFTYRLRPLTREQLAVIRRVAQHNYNYTVQEYYTEQNPANVYWNIRNNDTGYQYINHYGIPTRLTAAEAELQAVGLSTADAIALRRTVREIQWITDSRRVIVRGPSIFNTNSSLDFSRLSCTTEGWALLNCRRLKEQTFKTRNLLRLFVGPQQWRKWSERNVKPKRRKSPSLLSYIVARAVRGEEDQY